MKFTFIAQDLNGSLIGTARAIPPGVMNIWPTFAGVDIGVASVEAQSRNLDSLLTSMNRSNEILSGVRRAPAIITSKKSAVQVKYANVGLFGTAALFDEIIDNGKRPRLHLCAPDCFTGAMHGVELQLGHEGPVLAANVKCWQDHAALHFAAARLILNAATEEFVHLANSYRFGATPFKCSIKASPLRMHRENRYGRSVDVFTRASLIHIAVLQKPERPACTGTSAAFQPFFG